MIHMHMEVGEALESWCYYYFAHISQHHIFVHISYWFASFNLNTQWLVYFQAARTKFVCKHGIPKEIENIPQTWVAIS